MWPFKFEMHNIELKQMDQKMGKNSAKKSPKFSFHIL